VVEVSDFDATGCREHGEELLVVRLNAGIDDVGQTSACQLEELLNDELANRYRAWLLRASPPIGASSSFAEIERNYAG
jgi:hypothetical protein